ncbi:MAG TPA: alpha-glucan family phosphorylase [Bacteroidales bacterium]|nr:alpha-glucan family phosphorylase [Bacteroidales bacterium]
MSNKTTIMPDYLFEVSWEVCNKVGGIYTVVSTKALTLSQQLGSNYILIGPDVWRDGVVNPEFVEDKRLFKSWRDKAAEEGLRIKVGHWNIAGNPVAIIVDFTTFISQKDTIFSKFWEKYKLDSITGQWDYIEPCLFGYAAGRVIESFAKFNLSVRDRIVAQFHEWMTGSGLLYLKSEMPQIGTVFTTHATAMGRSIAGNNQPLYSNIKDYIPDLKAAEFNIISKQSLEKNSAQHADCFTTVSEITNLECEAFLGKNVDVVTPNGFEDSFVPTADKFDQARLQARKKLIEVASALTDSKINDDVLLIANSGRYEFRNKGIDLFIDSLGEINKSGHLNKEVVAFILIPANHYGPRRDLANKLKGQEYEHCDECILTHNLHYPEHDSILKRIKANGLTPSETNKVKVIFVPSYLNGDDGIFNMSYYQLLIGFDLTVFPSYYEPWGYTPLESIAFKVPTITTSLAGFGLWIKQLSMSSENAVTVIERTDINDAEVTHQIAGQILKFSNLNAEQVENARNLSFEMSRTALWKNLVSYYLKAYEIALSKVQERTSTIAETEKIETLTAAEKFSVTNDPVWKRLLVQKNIPEELHALEELSKNLWWSWNYDAIDLFRSIDPELWVKSDENPIVLLDLIPYEKILKLSKDVVFLKKLNDIYNKFLEYQNKPCKVGPKIAYFSMEYGLHDSIKLYSGGLGVLAGDYLKEASDANIDIIGVGLLYRYGYFKQVISEHGDQIAQYESQKFSQTPVQPVRDANGQWLTIHINLPGRPLIARIWRLSVGRIPLFLLDTDFEDNIEQDRSITHHLYGGDWDNRFKQELLLGVGGIRALDTLGISPDLFHCNEGHAAFIGVERLRKYIVDQNLTFAEGLELVRSSQLFTTHTPVPAGHDAFDESMMRTYMGHYPKRLKISWLQFMALGKAHPDNPSEKFSMSVLAANLSQEINGVSELHGRVSQEIFHDMYRGYAAEELNIGFVTNGVHMPTWTARPWMELYKSTFGDDFFEKQTKFETWAKIQQVPNSNIWKIRNSQRQILVDYIKDRLKDAAIKRLENPKMVVEMCDRLNKHNLTIGFARRFATYKRAHLLFNDIERLSRIVNNPSMPVQFVFAGKAHPHDKAGQDLIKLISEISKKPQFVGKIIFIPNYDMKLAKILVQGVDIWLNTPTRPLEASGTSGEKAVMNGVLHFSVLDGWWAEGYVDGAGWALPEEVTYQNNAYQDQLDAETIYNLIENEIAPLFYFRDENGLPNGWVQYIKNSIEKVASHFTMSRQLEDYNTKFYTKLYDRTLKVQANDYQLAKEMARWKKKVRSSWESIEVVSTNIPDVSREAISLGNSYVAQIELDLNELAPEDIGVELVLADLVGDESKPKVSYCQEFELVKYDGQIAQYRIEMRPQKTGVYEYGIRLFPKHPELPHRQDFNYVRWLE